jgi:voltage-gated potassium channel
MRRKGIFRKRLGWGLGPLFIKTERTLGMESYKSRLRIYLVLFGVVSLIGVFGFSYAEGISLLNSLYFFIVTVATVGYGDIHPQTPLGKILAVILIVGGVGTFLGVIANATEILLSRREEKVRLQKLHMVTGLFFSELGTRLLKQFIAMDRTIDMKQRDLIAADKWSDKDFKDKERKIAAYAYAVNLGKEDLHQLRNLLESKTDFLLRLLENPLVLEQGSFSDLLRAVFHFRDELLNRPRLSDLPESDRRHLEGDVARIYVLVVHEWFVTMRYLKDNYPYLFSLAMRTNPFDPNASVVVQA